MGVSPSRRVLIAAERMVRHLVPPTLYFLVVFNLISFTTDMMVHNYWFNIRNVVLASTTALVVAKVVLVVDRIRIIDRFRGGPLIWPILYKSVFYSFIVLLVRFIEKVVEFAIDADGFGPAFRDTLQQFTWHKFVAVHLWIFVCFVVYVAASEFNALVGPGQLRRLFFHHRSSEYGLTRQQHIRSLMEFNRLAESTPREQLLDPTTPAGRRLVEIVDALRRRTP